MNLQGLPSSCQLQPWTEPCCPHSACRCHTGLQVRPRWPSLHQQPWPPPAISLAWDEWPDQWHSLDLQKTPFLDFFAVKLAYCKTGLKYFMKTYENIWKLLFVNQSKNICMRLRDQKHISAPFNFLFLSRFVSSDCLEFAAMHFQPLKRSKILQCKMR